MSKPMTEREVSENAARARDQREAMEASLDKADERKLDSESSRDERLAELKRELADLREKMALKDVEFQRKKEAWLNADFRGFREDHPFNILIQTGHDAVSSLPVRVCVNGDWSAIKRGEWVRVPYKVVHALGNGIVNATQQMVADDGNVFNAVILRNRHPYSALPLECFRQDQGECACEPPAKTLERKTPQQIAIAA